MITDEKIMSERLTEIKQLYDISEAEGILMVQMLMMIKITGYGPKLTVKLLKAITAFMEIVEFDI